MSPTRLFAFSERVLDPATRLGEILFGLIMTLTFTLGAGFMIEKEGREGAYALLIALVGCNLAWGIIDGMLYLVLQLFDRSRRLRLGRAIRLAPDMEQAVEVIAAELDERLSRLMSNAQREHVYRLIVAYVRAQPGEPVRVTKADLLGGVASFWLVFLASLPAAVPFLIIEDARLALRVSNAILLAFLFFTGYCFGQYTLGHPLLIGFGLLALGIVLVATAIVLGG